jgi:diacylglycerol O-acyltransferase / wax synthase
MIERLTTGDLAMLVPDQFGWPQDIAAIAIVDGAPLFDEAGELRIEKIREAIAARLHLVPRFRQLLVEPHRGLGVPFWTDAQTFDIVAHVRVFPLQDGAGEEGLLDAFEQIRARGFDRARPLWEMWFLPGLQDDRVGLVIKLHHTVADGIAGVATLAAFLDVSPRTSIATGPAWHARPRPSRIALFADNLRQRVRELAKPLLALLHPRRTLRMFARVRPMLREMRDKAPTTSLGRLIGPGRRVMLVRSRLDTLKTIAHAHGAKINDVLLTAIAGAVRALLIAREESVDGLVLRVAVPISAHPAAENARGNRDSGMVAHLPIGEPDEVACLHTIAHDTRTRKQQPRGVFGAVAFPGVMAILRAMYRRFGHQRAANIYVANVPGPPMPMYIAGAKLLEIFPFVPLTGNLSLAAGALSYAGQFAISVVADRDACPDVEVFASAVSATLDELARKSSTAHAA